MNFNTANHFKPILQHFLAWHLDVIHEIQTKNFDEVYFSFYDEKKLIAMEI